MRLTDRIDLALVIRARVEELACRLVGDAVDRELPGLDGARSATAWLTGTRRVSAADAARLLRDQFPSGMPKSDVVEIIV